MNEIEKLRRLDAADPAPPAVDVAPSVLRAIARLQPAPRRERVFPFMALLGSAACVAVVALAMQSLSAITDPLAGLASPLNMVMQ